jgi:predicted TIM-barrel fold metal-dependent hydrolase
VYVLGLAITAKPYQEHTPVGIRYDGGAGAGSPEERLREQDLDGVEAEILFTSAGNSGFWRGIKDDAAYCAVIHAYNEFLAEEYCAYDRDRLVATGLIPNAGIPAAIAELEYCAKAGLKCIALGALPSGKSYPTPEDDRFWAAALDHNMPITVHVQMGAGDGGPPVRFPLEPGGLPNSANPGYMLTGTSTRARNGVQLALAGVFDRFPKLKIYFAETNIGWFPSSMEQLDDQYERVRYWGNRFYGMEPLKRLPSEYIRDHCYFGFLKDYTGVELRHKIGVDHIMWSADFPHGAGDWPHSMDLVNDMFAGVPDDERYAMLAGNAVDYFRLDNEA